MSLMVVGCTLKMLQLLQQFEHLAIPLAQAVELFVNSFGVKGIVSELMRSVNTCVVVLLWMWFID